MKSKQTRLAIHAESSKTLTEDSLLAGWVERIDKNLYDGYGMFVQRCNGNKEHFYCTYHGKTLLSGAPFDIMDAFLMGFDRAINPVYEVKTNKK